MTASFDRPSGNTLQLALATGAFAVCFAVFGSVSAMMPIMRKQLGFTPLQVSIALAVPVLLGSLGRIPLGILTDRLGGRRVFSLVMAAAIVPALIMGRLSSFVQVVICGLFLGIALASFAVGVGFVSRWYPPERQGMAVGVYGAGNIGQSLAAFGSPLLAGWLGYRWGFQTFGIILAAWLAIFLLLARNAPATVRPRSLRETVAPLSERMSWVLSLYYFLTFGGFVAMGIYLPTFLTELFHLTPQDAGFRTAGFVVLATGMRPLGGWLADRVGGRAILLYVFPVTAVAALLLIMNTIDLGMVVATHPFTLHVSRMALFTVGALGMAAAIGMGNGAVFKLVPEYFPTTVGAVTGLVGAAGGLGGFFPPLVVGILKKTTGDYSYGFILLSLFALGCYFVARQVGRPTVTTVARAA